MEWKLSVVDVYDRWVRAIVGVESGKVVAIVDNLDNCYVKHIINEHNETISLARKEGVKIAKEVYMSKK